MQTLDTHHFIRVNPALISVSNRLRDFTHFYPDIISWFNNSVVAGLSDGSRRLFVSNQSGLIDGLLIAKNDGIEKKICTLWVAPSKRRTGLSDELMNDALEWLQCSRPLLSLPEETFHSFESLIRRYDFSIHQIAPNYYRPDKVEYVLNGKLPFRRNSQLQ